MRTSEPISHISATLDVERVIHEFFRSLDGRAYDKLVALMAGDGIWRRQGKELRGHQAVMDAMQARPSDFTTLHAISNLIVDCADERRAVASFYATVFAHTGNRVANDPFPMSHPNVVAVYNVQLLRNGDDWRISQMESDRVFQRAH